MSNNNNTPKCKICSDELVHDPEDDPILPGTCDNDYLCFKCGTKTSYIICGYCSKHEIASNDSIFKFANLEKKGFFCPDCLKEKEIKTNPPITPSVIIAKEDEIACCVCLVNLPNTLVIPCGHCVVCKECSDKLKETTNSKTCVYCKTQITSIFE